MYHSFLIHSSADGHLGCFHVLAMINSAVQGLCYCMGFSLVTGSRGCSPAMVGGLLLWAQTLGHTGFSSWGARA